MGCTIQFESHRGELAFIYQMEHDPTVLAFYDQPEPIKLTYQGKRASKWVCSTRQISLCSVKMAGDGSSAKWRISFLNWLSRCPIATCALPMELGRVLQARRMRGR